MVRCDGDRCCNLRVVYLRFEAIPTRLHARKAAIPAHQLQREAAKEAAQEEWQWYSTRPRWCCFKVKYIGPASMQAAGECVSTCRSGPLPALPAPAPGSASAAAPTPAPAPASAPAASSATW